MRYAVLGIVMFAACSRGEVNKAGLMDDVRTAMNKEGVTSFTLDCPDPPDAKAGATFTCTGKNKADGRPFSIHATVVGSSGDTKWELVGEIVEPVTLGRSIESSMTEKLGKPVTVGCSGSPIIIAAHESITCPFEVSTEAGKVRLTMDDTDSRAAWMVVP